MSIYCDLKGNIFMKKQATTIICYLFQLLIRGFAMLTPIPLKETLAMYTKDDLLKII
jgi:hypothetical protein